jgi:hypothetical protein
LDIRSIFGFGHLLLNQQQKERKKDRLILDVYLSAAAERNMFVVIVEEKFLNSLIKDKIMENKHTHTFNRYGGSGTWYLLYIIYVDYYYFSK